MDKNSFEGKVFEKTDFLTNGEYSEFINCTFRQCDFSNVSLDSNDFEKCQFISCNLSMVTFNNCALKEVHFIDCKVIGVDFSKCSKFLFSVSFSGSILNYSFFFKNDLKNTVFKNSILKEVNFIETNLFASKFIDSDLENSIFEKSNLEKADFTTAFNYSINPSLNKIKKAKFSMPEAMGLLKSFDIIIS